MIARGHAQRAAELMDEIEALGVRTQRALDHDYASPNEPSARMVAAEFDEMAARKGALAQAHALTALALVSSGVGTA